MLDTLGDTKGKEIKQREKPERRRKKTENQTINRADWLDMYTQEVFQTNVPGPLEKKTFSISSQAIWACDRTG